jgi:hypothetical protein
MSGWVAGAVVGSAALGAYSSNKAAKAQAGAAERSAELGKEVADQQVELQREQYNQTRADQTPFREAGVNALTRMQGGEFGVPGAFQFDPSQVSMDPGYSFRLSEGQKALDRQAAARGGLISGSALKAATRFGQDMGSQEYSNAYNRSYGRAMDEYNSRINQSNTGYNRLASMAGIGQTANSQLGAAGQNYASGVSGALGNYAANAGNAYGAAGQAQASGYMGMANAAGQGVSQYLGYQSNNNLLNALQNRGRSSYISDPYSGYSSEIGIR